MYFFGRYALGDTYSLAVNIPQNQDPDSLQQVLQDDPANKVQQTVSQGQVYQGTRVVAATQSEAVSHVLENIQPFIKSSDGNFLIIYSEESPCGPTCTNTIGDSIASKIKDVIQNWRGYAFVFSNAVSDPAADTSHLGQSFKQLTISKLGLDHIFRCYQPRDNAFQCTSCSSGGDVAPSCVANTNQEPADQGQETINKVVGIGETIGAGIGRGIAAGIGRGTGEQIVEGKPGQVRKCKEGGDCKLRRGGKRRGGKVGKGKKRGGKGRKRGKLRRGRKGKGKRRGKGKKHSNRGGKSKKSGTRRKSGKRKSKRRG